MLVKVSATDLATLISKDMLIKHYDMLKTSYVGYRITYLIEVRVKVAAINQI